MSKIRVLLLGSKEYPLGTRNPKEDPHPSGGIEVYVEGLAKALSKKTKLIIVTRLFKGTKSHETTGNVEIYRVPFKKGFYFRNPTFNLNAYRLASKLDFDIIISNGEVANKLGLRISRKGGKPIIMVSHGLASEQPQYNPLIRSAFRRIDKTTYPHADAVITHAPHQLKGLTKKFYVVYPGLEKSRVRQISKEEKIQLKRFFGVKPNETVVLYTGRLIKVKGLEYLLQALTLLNLPYKCLIVGGGPQKEEYVSLARRLGTNTIFVGYREDISKFLSIADVFVLPSLSESLNYSLLEAAYMKVPIIVTDLGIIPKNCALIVPKKSSYHIAKAIQAISKNKSLRVTVSKNAKSFVKKFNWDKAANEYLKIIQKLTK